MKTDRFGFNLTTGSKSKWKKITCSYNCNKELPWSPKFPEEFSLEAQHPAEAQRPKVGFILRLCAKQLATVDNNSRRRTNLSNFNFYSDKCKPIYSGSILS